MLCYITRKCDISNSAITKRFFALLQTDVLSMGVYGLETFLSRGSVKGCCESVNRKQ